MAVAACGGGGGTPGPSVIVVDVGVDRPAPPLTGTALDGTSVSLADLRGRPVIVNFWASWCVPCRQEFPLFKTALARHASDRLAIVGVLFNDSADAARAFAASEGAGWPSLPDPTGAAAHAYRVPAPPQTFFVDREGVIRAAQLGQIADEAELESLLAKALR
ncbi:MAG TPA: TlpA disulfide reductase family protein [Candidatus Limnocylindrales bacterium]